MSPRKMTKPRRVRVPETNRDLAIVELTHIAEALVKQYEDQMPGIIREALGNKISYYRQFANYVNVDSDGGNLDASSRDSSAN